MIVAFLRQYRDMKTKIADVEIQLQDIYTNVSCGGISYEERIQGTNKFNSITENTAINIAAKTTKLKQEKCDLIFILSRIDNAMDTLLIPQEKDIVKKRYIEHTQFKDIAVCTNNNTDHCKYVCDKAIKKLDDFFREGL